MDAIFISWSGSRSEALAIVLRDWLPQVLQSVEPFVSSEDIAKGARWSPEIARRLEEATFGLICVTAENVDSAWLNFEAGALAKRFEQSRVCPLLLDHKSDQIQGPLAQFQAGSLSKADMLKAVKSMNSACGVPRRADLLEISFEKWWPDFAGSVKKIGAPESPVERRNPESILAEILEIVRSQARMSTGRPSVPASADVHVTRYVASGVSPYVEVDEALSGARGAGYDWWVGDLVEHRTRGRGVVRGVGRDSSKSDSANSLIVVDYTDGESAHDFEDPDLARTQDSPRRGKRVDD